MAIQHNVNTRSSARTMMYDKPIYSLMIKRVLDIVISLILIILCLPLFLIISYRIYTREGKPVFYREVRMGKHNQPFIMRTFRTKTVPSQVIRSLPPLPVPDAWENGVPSKFTLKSNSYTTITPTGEFLLKFKLHKLPLLFHVLKGDMSLVGPQAELIEVAKYYNEHQNKRLELKPGITGYAQIHNLYNDNHRQKVLYDLYYIRNYSLRFDLKILFQSIKKLI